MTISSHNAVTLQPLRSMASTALAVRPLAPAATFPRPVLFSGETTALTTWQKGVRWGKNLVFVAIGALGMQGYNTITTPSPNAVVKIHDGDSFYLANKELDDRIFGIDAPELSQPLGPEAKEALAYKLQGGVPTLKRKSSSHGRPVVEVHLYGRDIAAEMVREGWAFSELEYGKDRYHQEEAEARQAKRGVWKLPNGGERPWDYRKHPTHKPKTKPSSKK